MTPDDVGKQLNGSGNKSNKELVIEAIRRLPEDLSLEEISEQIAVLAAIRRGEEDAEAGRVVTHEEVKTRLASWKNSR
jgi:predicted transcriptional regulator